MDDQDTGQPPTKKMSKPTATPRKQKPKQQEPTRSSQRASKQGFISYPGHLYQERRMLRHVIPFLIDNRTHPARQAFIGIAGMEIKEQVEQDTEMTIEELRRHITSVANKRYVIKTEGTPPLIKYTQSFLDEFNTTEITESDEEERHTSQTQPAHDEDDDVSSTTEASINLLEPSQEEEHENISIPNMISPPPILTTTTTTKRSKYKPKKLHFVEATQMTQTSPQKANNNKEGDETEDHKNDESDEEEDEEPVDLIEAFHQVDTQFQAAVDGLDEYITSGTTDTNQRNQDIADWEDEEQQRSIELKIAQEVDRQLSSQPINDRIVDQLIQQMYGEMNERLANVIKEVENRSEQLEHTQARLEDTEKQLDKILLKTKEATNTYEELQGRLTTINTKINDEYNRRKYQREQTYTKMFEEERTKIQNMLDGTITKTLAKHEERFQKYLTRESARKVNEHEQKLQDKYDEKQQEMISNHDTMTADLKRQMMEDFDESWKDFKQHQLSQQIQHATTTLIKENIGDIDKIYNNLITQMEQQGKTTLDTFTRNSNTLTYSAVSSIQTEKDKAKKEIEKSKDDAMQAMDIENSKPTTTGSTMNVNKDELAQEILEQVQKAKTDISELADKHLNQLRSENGRIQKDLSNEHSRIQKDLRTIKTDLLADVDIIKIEVKEEMLKAIDHVRETKYFRENISHTQAPPLTQPSMSQQTMETNDDYERNPPRQEDTQTTRTPIFGKPGDTLEERKREYEERIAQEDKKKNMQTRSITVMEKLHRLHSKNFDDIIYIQGNDPPNQAQIVTFYTAITNLFNSLNIPIVPYHQLSLTSGTAPIDEPLEPKVQTMVSSLLYQKLNSSIPQTWHKIRTIIEAHSTTQDGYSALFSIMTNNSGSLKLFRSLWGPTWNPTMNAYQYLTELRIYLSEQYRYNTRFTTYEIAAEIIQQANQHERYKVIATTHLTALQNIDPRGRIPAIFEEQRLIDSIDANEQRIVNIPIDPTINKFRGSPRNGNIDTEGKGPRKFTYRREVQCSICSTYGHEIDQDVCKVGAQVYHVCQFIKDNKEKATKNAKAYSLANNKNKIAKMQLLSPNKPIEDIQEELSQIAYTFIDDDEDDGQE
jgi:hypothetical protein